MLSLHKLLCEQFSSILALLMSTLKRIILCLCFFSLISTIDASFFTDTVQKPWGVRAAGLGKAYSAIAEGGSAMVYNPAGFALPGFSYTFETLNFDSPTQEKFSVNSLLVSPFSLAYWSRSLSDTTISVLSYGYGSRGSNGIDWGVNYKSIYEKYSGYERSSWSSDVGIMAHVFSYMDLAIVGRDILGMSSNIPMSVSLGMALFTDSKDIRLSTELSYETNDLEQRVFNSAIGLEMGLSDGFITRVGLSQTDFTFGLRMQLPFLTLDWGAQNKLSDNSTGQYLAGFTLGKDIIESRASKRYSLFKPSAYAEFRIGGNLKEGKSEVSLLGGYRLGANDLLSLIHTANLDPTCKGFIIRVGRISSSISSIGLIQELREELAMSKKKGKKIYIYLEHWSTFPEYYLSAIADKIFMPELGVISHLGLDLEIVRAKSILSNWGTRTTVISSGKHKSSLNPGSNKISDDSRMVLEGVVNDLYQQVLSDIKKDRNLVWNDISDLFTGRLISAQEAKEKGLVDQLGYYNSISEMIKKSETPITRTVKISLKEYTKPIPVPSIFTPHNRFAIIEIDGQIHMGGSGSNFLFGGQHTGSDDIVQTLRNVEKDPTIKGVILRINSGGGSLLASDHIYQELTKLREKKIPIYASLGNVAASGGYYIALGADKIFTNPGTLTGSIGVITEIKDKSEFHELLGIETEVIKTGKYQDMMTSYRKISEEEESMFKSFQRRHYDLFVSKVMDRRSLTREEATEVAQGQVVIGEKALQLGLVDDIGHFYQVVDQLALETDVSSPELVYFRNSPTNLATILGRFLGLSR